eukprot:Hpha_TRINITY_DN5612_c0_g1::TRINITY_DN5612_c0_g1_i1::g.50652::m.50652
MPCAEAVRRSVSEWTFPAPPFRDEARLFRRRRAVVKKRQEIFETTLERVRGAIREKCVQDSGVQKTAPHQRAHCGEEFAVQGFSFESFPGEAMPATHFSVERRRAAERAEGVLLCDLSEGIRQRLLVGRDKALQLGEDKKEKGGVVVKGRLYAADLPRQRGTIVVLSSSDSNGFVLGEGHGQRLLQFRVDPGVRLHEGAKVFFTTSSASSSQAENVRPAAAPPSAPLPHRRRPLPGRAVATFVEEELDIASVDHGPPPVRGMYELMLSRVTEPMDVTRRRVEVLQSYDLCEGEEEVRSRRGPRRIVGRTLFETLHPLSTRELEPWEVPVDYTLSHSPCPPPKSPEGWFGTVSIPPQKDPEVVSMSKTYRRPHHQRDVREGFTVWADAQPPPVIKDQDAQRESEKVLEAMKNTFLPPTPEPFDFALAASVERNMPSEGL